MSLSVSIVVPNWNGSRLLPRALGGMMMTAAASGLDYEIIVADDASTDDSVTLVQSKFPRVRLITKQYNTGFGDTANVGVAHARGDVVVLLNNDLVPREPMLAELVSPLVGDSRLFGVTGRTVNWRASEADHVCMAGSWSDGELCLTWEDPKEPSPALFLLGGCCAFRRHEFHSLGGFQPLFSPGYWEDYDLSYQAAKCGWKNLYNPRAEAYHFGSVSMNQRHGVAEIRALRARNRILFHWLNFTDEDFVKSMGRSVAGYYRRAACGDETARDWVRGYCRAKAMLPLVEAELERRAGYSVLTDREVLSHFLEHGRQN
jgi:GT2 family glycosyltransferase